MRHVLSLLIILSLISSVKAETIRAMCRELPDIVTEELEDGQTGNLTVYLKSSGDPVDGFVVQLFKVPYRRDSKPIAEQKSDRHGLVVFRNLSPGSYHFQLKDDEKPRLTVDIGDMRISKQ